MFVFALTDGSSGSLDVCSDSGNIDVYVGQSSSAKVFSQSGEAWKSKHHVFLRCLEILNRLDLPPCCSLFVLVWCGSGVVCVRVPSSLRAWADLVGTSVEVSPDVALQEADRSVTGGQTQVTGEWSGKPAIQVRNRVLLYYFWHFLSQYYNMTYFIFLLQI